MSVYKDKVCVITGAASGMGRELARQLSSQGAVLAILRIMSLIMRG